MKRLLMIFCSITVVFDIIAQQDPQYSQYMFNQMAVNPGYAGSQEAICFTAVHRQQWVGIEGAPETSVVTANSPFKLFGADHGFSVTLMRDVIGFDTNISGGLGYAFRLPLGKGKLGIGVGGKFLNKALAATWNIPGGDAGSDPAIPEEKQSVTGYDMGIGVFYRAENVYMGISTSQLLQSPLKLEGIADPYRYRLRRHYYATAGCTLPLNNPAWSVSPSLMAYSDGTVTQFTGNLNLMYNNKIWAGMGYRLNDSVIAMVGFDLFNGIKIGYSFDYTYSSLKTYFTAGGSHEIMLNYCFTLVKEKVVKKYKSVRFL